MKVRKRGPVFDAEQFLTPDGIEPVARAKEAKEKAVVETEYMVGDLRVMVDEHGAFAHVETPRGRLRWNAGDWKVTHPNGTASIIPADAFERAYEPVE